MEVLLQQLPVPRDGLLVGVQPNVLALLPLAALLGVQQARHAAVEAVALLLAGDGGDRARPPAALCGQWAHHVQPLDQVARHGAQGQALRLELRGRPRAVGCSER